MLEKDVVGSVCVHIRLNMSLLHSSRRCCKVFTPKQCPLDPARMYITLVVETFGLWLSHSVDVSKSIARRSALHNHLTVSQATSHLHQQLSIKLWLYNSKVVLERLAYKSREDIFGLI